jgi:hypothetical protein
LDTGKRKPLNIDGKLLKEAQRMTGKTEKATLG